MKLNNKQRGFTLLELLVVVAVMAVIAGAALMSMEGQEEHAGQGVAMHNMQTLENATRQFSILNKKLPDNLESILCTNSGATTTNGMTVGVTTNPDDPDTQDNTLINNAAGTGDGSTLAATDARIFGGLSDAGLVGGGLTNAFASKLSAMDIPAAGVNTLFQAGITSLQFADANGCDDLDTTNSISNESEDVALDEYALMNVAFDTPGNGGGFGLPVTLDPAASAPLMVYEDPEDLGRAATDIIVVLGIGNSSELVTDGRIIAKGSRDGNVPGDKYGHFSLALRIGVDDGANALQYEADDTWLAEPELVAIIDADGDYYEEEIAEFSGMQDE